MLCQAKNHMLKLSQGIQRARLRRVTTIKTKYFNRRYSFHLNRINKENFHKEFKRNWAYFKSVSGANTKQLDYYSFSMLVDEKPNTSYKYRLQQNPKIELSHNQLR